MYPEMHKGFPRCCLRLGNFIGVMNIYVINSTGMDIYGFTECFHCHSTTFNMPSGKSNTPRALPLHLPPCFTRSKLPEGKVCRMLFSFYHIYSGACF